MGVGRPSKYNTPWHGATYKAFDLVARVRGGEGLSCKVSDPTTELAVTRRDETALLAVQGVLYFEGRPTPIKMG